MSSAGQVIGAVVGGVVGFFVGGPAGALKGAAFGATLGGAIDPPPGPNIEGPRLDDLSVQSASYGVPIPEIEGTAPISGNVFWLENNQIKETVNKKKQGGKGGGGATTTTYTYSATFAVALADQTIAEVVRGWVGPDLQANPASTDLETIIATNALRDAGVSATPKAGTYRVYYGTDDQMPDPRMEADLGVGNCPAYRGMAYVVFYDLPLDKYSNSLQVAQTKFEVASTTNAGAGLVADVNVQSGIDYTIAPYIYSADVSTKATWNTTIYTHNKNGIKNREQQSDPNADFLPANEFASPGVFVYVGRLGDGLLSVNISNFTYVEGVHIVRNGNTINTTNILGIPDVEKTNKKIANCTVNADGTLMIIGLVDDTEDIFGSPAGNYYVLDVDLNLISSGTADALDPYSIIGVGRSARYHFGAGCLSEDGNKVYFVYGAGARQIEVYDISDGHLSNTPDDTIESAIADAGSATRPAIYVKNGFIYVLVRDRYFRFQDDAFGVPATVPLADVVSRRMLRSEFIEAGDLDVSQLTGNVRGYRIPGAQSIRSSIQPLQNAYFFDIFPSGYQIKCLPRGRAPVKTISGDDLDARLFGQAPSVELPMSREMDSQLPRKVIVRHLDAARDYDINEQYSPERISSQSVNIREYDLPLVLTPDEASQVAEVLQYAPWKERVALQFNLPPTHLDLEPADVVILETDKGTFTVRLDILEYLSTGVVSVKSARLEEVNAWTSSAVGGQGITPDGTIAFGGDSDLVLLDIPLIRDVDDEAGFAVAMAGQTSAWPGGVLMRSTDNEQTWDDLQSFSSPVTAGIARDPLTVHDSLVIDRDSTLTIDLFSEDMDLESITEAQLLQNRHWCAYGADGRWELIRFANQTLNADGSYTISTLIRGARGTERFTGTHQVGDLFVFLDDDDLAFVGADLQFLRVERDYRGVTVGQDLDDVGSTQFAYNGVNLKPLSPVHPAGTLNVNDWDLSWVRRSRLSTSWWTTGVERPLGEETESWEIDIMDGSTVVRTLTATTNSVTYTSADQVTDFGANQTSMTARIYQMSATVGRGYELEHTFT